MATHFLARTSPKGTTCNLFI